MLVLVLYVLKEVLNEEFICYKYIKEVFGVEVLYIKKKFVYVFILFDWVLRMYFKWKILLGVENLFFIKILFIWKKIVILEFVEFFLF